MAEKESSLSKLLKQTSIFKFLEKNSENDPKDEVAEPRAKRQKTTEPSDESRPILSPLQNSPETLCLQLSTSSDSSTMAEEPSISEYVTAMPKDCEQTDKLTELAADEKPGQEAIEDISANNSEEEAESDEEYEVEQILDYKFCKVQNKGLYLIKWLGYDDENDNTWEPASNLNCPEKLRQFYLQRMEEREKAAPGRKRILEVPPDPRPLTERMAAFTDEIFHPPCFTDLEKYFKANKNQKFQAWSSSKLNENLKVLATKKVKPEKKLGLVREQLMWKFMTNARQQQLERLKEWENEINSFENTLVKVENDVDLEGPPRHMTYITEYKPAPGIVIPNDPVIGCQDCGSQCTLKNHATCCSSANNTLFPYDGKGRLRVDVGVAVYECNRRCRCGPDCRNRVVQHGRKFKLCIFRTSNGCGWGVKALQNIKKGSFVADYVGEVISNEEAEERGKKYDAEGRTYLFDLDFNSDKDHENMYTVDAMYFGNVAHFINHSCDPNLSIFNVWIDCLDPELPRLCLFARRDIAKGEQITFDYRQESTQNYVLEDVKELPNHQPKVPANRTECRCGARKCRKILFE